MGAVARSAPYPIRACLACYYLIAPAEHPVTRRYDGVKYGPPTKQLAGHIGLTEKTRDEASATK